MPHLVRDFIRTTSGFTQPKSKNKNKNKTRPQNKRSITATSTSSESSLTNSDGEDGHTRHNNRKSIHIIDVTHPNFNMKKRLSLPFGRLHGRDSFSGPPCPVAIDWNIESPPLVFHGTPSESAGALVSGEIYLDVRDESGNGAPVEIEAFTATLQIHVLHKRAAHTSCLECQHQRTTLKEWQFFVRPVRLTPGRHRYPFSALLDGHLPATVETAIHGVSYDFKAEARLPPAATGVTNNSSAALSLKPTMVTFERKLPVTRALPEPDHPHHSIRVFPPTNIKAGAYYASVIRPTSLNDVSLRLDGLASLNEKTGMMDLWKLKKVTWKLEQTVRTVAPACEKHVHLANVGDGRVEDAQGRPGVERHETRILGEKMLHSGWTSDFSAGKDGSVDMDFKYSLNNLKPRDWKTRAACDSRSRDGTTITHALLIELVVSKEYAPEGKPHLSAPTGTGRILRMTYNVAITDSPGEGISWDEEQPPVYGDVPPSPPGYPVMELPVDYEDVAPLEYPDLQTLDAQRDHGSDSRRGSSG